MLLHISPLQNISMMTRINFVLFQRPKEAAEEIQVRIGKQLNDWVWNIAKVLNISGQIPAIHSWLNCGFRK